MVFRGVSSTVKLSVSKTELGGSNPSAPARIKGKAEGEVEVSSSRGKREVMATAVEQNAITSTLRSWPERIKSFYSDVRTEMKKVTSPSRKEVQATTTVVIITVFLFAFYFWLVDLAISNSWSECCIISRAVRQRAKEAIECRIRIRIRVLTKRKTIAQLRRALAKMASRRHPRSQLRAANLRAIRI